MSWRTWEISRLTSYRLDQTLPKNQWRSVKYIKSDDYLHHMPLVPFLPENIPYQSSSELRPKFCFEPRIFLHLDCSNILTENTRQDELQSEFANVIEQVSVTITFHYAYKCSKENVDNDVDRTTWLMTRFLSRVIRGQLSVASYQQTERCCARWELTEGSLRKSFHWFLSDWQSQDSSDVWPWLDWHVTRRWSVMSCSLLGLGWNYCHSTGQGKDLLWVWWCMR